MLKKPFILPIVILVGVAIAFVLVRRGDPIVHEGGDLPRRTVEVLEVRKIPFRSQVTAFGTVEPSVLLEGKAEVSGRISYLHPALKSGSSLPAETVVARIEQADYEVSLKQTQADLEANRQSLEQLDEEEKTARRSLKLARENLEYGEREYQRIEEIFQRQLVSRSTLEAEQQKVIRLRQNVEELQGQINSFRSRKNSVKALIARAEQQVKGEQTNLGRTEIIMPFDARIGEVFVERGEFVNIGTALFEAMDVNGVEIEAQLPFKHMVALVSHMDPVLMREFNVLGINEGLRQLNIAARVRLVDGRPGAVWDASVIRMSEGLDVTRRTLSLVVAVENPYGQMIPGQRPPLMNGMYTAIQFTTPAVSALVIPRRAVHEGRVYVVDAEQRLEIRQIEIKMRQGELVLVSVGLSEGERIVVTDLYPVIEGMGLDPVEPAQLREHIESLAAGEAER